MELKCTSRFTPLRRQASMTLRVPWMFIFSTSGHSFFNKEITPAR